MSIARSAGRCSNLCDYVVPDVCVRVGVCLCDLLGNFPRLGRSCLGQCDVTVYARDHFDQCVSRTALILHHQQHR